MYRIKDNPGSGMMKAEHSENIFHEMLAKGAKELSVIDAPFRDYCLEYVPNNDLIPERLRKIKKGIDIYPDYTDYNETDPEQIDLAILKDHQGILYETLDEYTVVTAKVALAYTDMTLFFTNEGIRNFLPDSDRIRIVGEFPEGSLDDDRYLKIVDEFVTGTFQGHYHRLCPLTLFHCLFYRQALTDLPLSDIRFVEVAIAPNVGIGGVLSYYSKMKHFFAAYGWEVFLKEGCTRYSGELLEKYFGIPQKPDGSVPSNTVYLREVLTVFDVYSCAGIPDEIDENILSEKFRREMNEYTEAVLSGYNTLGVLIRGTDYIASKMPGSRKMATAGEMIPLIREWIKEDGYDRIFLATEDQDILDTMRAEFGSMLITVSQVRHRVSDFVDVSLISDLEKAENSPEEYENVLEDNTVNYFYALFILSKCESFMASGQCHGWTVANSFNHGKYRRAYKFSAGRK